MIELPIQDIYAQWGKVFLHILLPSSKKYYLPTIECTTPFCISWEGSNYYVSGNALKEYEDAWINDQVN